MSIPRHLCLFLDFPSMEERENSFYLSWQTMSRRDPWPSGPWRWDTSLPQCPELLLLGADWHGLNGGKLGLQSHGLHMTPVAKQGSWEKNRMTLFGIVQINIFISQKLLQIGGIYFEIALKMVLCIARWHILNVYKASSQFFTVSVPDFAANLPAQSHSLGKTKQYWFLLFQRCCLAIFFTNSCHWTLKGSFVIYCSRTQHLWSLFSAGND